MTKNTYRETTGIDPVTCGSLLSFPRNQKPLVNFNVYNGFENLHRALLFFRTVGVEGQAKREPS